MGTPRAQPLHAAPEVLGDYQVLLPIGAGGMGDVYLARKRVVGDVYRDYAVKLLRLDRLGAAESTRMFLEEAKIAARIRHANVVSVLEVADGAFGVYLVMDYVEGVDLATLRRLGAAKREAMPLPVVARVLHDALAGLHGAHEQRDSSGEPLRIVHRDVSPQNLLVGVDGTTRLTDFGIAKARSRPDTTEEGEIKGKLRYMAPEQAHGLPLDRRADVWSAGVVAWEAIAGRHLFHGDSDAELLLRVISSEQVPPLCQLRPGVPVEVDEALASALTIHRDARCPSALELQRRLDAAWRSADGMADAHEVAAYVREIAADELAGRRRRAAQSIAPRVGAGASSGDRPRVLAGPQPPVAAERSPTAEGDETETANVVDAATAGRRQTASSRTWIAVFATLAAAVSLGAYALRARAPSTSSAAESLVPTSAPAPPVMPPSATQARVPPPAPRLLAVHADAMLREVSIAGERILVGPPSRTVHVQLPAADAPVMVRVVAVDGRHAERLVHGDTSELSFELGATPRPPSAARPSTAPPSDKRLLPYPPSIEQSP